MKTIFTNCAVVCASLIAGTLSANSQTTYQYNFNSTPVLISGTDKAVNAIYRFANVSDSIDAIVTIVSATNGATVDIFDDNAITKPEGFSPKIKVPAHQTGLVEFQVCFVAAGTTTGNIQDSLNATAIDIDGNAQIKEIDVIDMGGGVSSYQPGTPEISVVHNGTAFTGTNIAGNEYDGIDTAARQVMYTVINTRVGCFTYKCGASNASGSAVSRQKSIYFKNFVYPPAAPLPVKYLSFNAVAANKAVNLSWATAWEMNNSHFEVERSLNRADFKTIAVVLDGITGADNSRNYKCRDNAEELKGRAIIYYRLKQVDFDGNITYSLILAVRLENGSASVMQISPNPFAKEIVVRFDAATEGIAELRIMNISGQLMLSRTATVEKGYNNIQVENLNRLPSGTYIAQLLMDGKIIESSRIIKN